MKRLLCVSLTTLIACSSTGCTLLRKNRNPKPKAVTAVSADTDANFKALWTAQRQKELVAQGLAPDAAAAKASEEYAARFSYTNPKR